MRRDGVYVVGFETRDGGCCYRFSLAESEKERLGEIQAYAAREGAGLLTQFADELTDVVAGPDAARVEPWSAFVRRQNAAFVDRLNQHGVSREAVSLISEGLDYQNRRSNFLARVEALPFPPEAIAEITRALDTATHAHRLQCSSRDRDDGSLAHIPYVSHPIEVAMLAIECGQSAPVIVAALLHDVLEDTLTKRDYLERHFSPEALALVDAATRQPTESRSDFMSRVGMLTGDAKVLKCLDRYHNMIRAFSASTPEYPKRNISENRTVYTPEFESNPALALLRVDFSRLNAELERFASNL